MTLKRQWSDLLPLSSARLVLRRFTREDVEPFLAYRNDPVVARFQSWESYSLAEAKALVARQELQKIGEANQWLQIGIALKQDGRLMGDCALKIHTIDAQQATFGITLARPFQGQGYGKEALAALLDCLFGRMRLHRVQADTDPDNTPACKLFERLGMRREAHHCQSLWFKGRWADEYIYAILASEWQEPREQCHERAQSIG
jgi:RimJ/RimL family protein N-acetyltransferase